MGKRLPRPKVLQRFGSLRVVIPEGRRNGKRSALCICDCGRLKAAFLKQLHSSSTCGAPVHQQQKLKGQRFGCRVVLQDFVEGRSSYALCRCDCGAIAEVFRADLRRHPASNCPSCCLKQRMKSDDGLRRAHESWRGMKQRTQNPAHKNWADYGGRGITVCPEWLESFERFYADLGPRPKGTTLERQDNDGPYAPWNCHWEAKSVQSRNKRSTVRVEVHGVEMCVKDAAQVLNKCRSRLSKGLKEGRVYEGVRLLT